MNYRLLYSSAGIISVILIASIITHLKYEFPTVIGLYMIIGASLVFMWVMVAFSSANQKEVGGSKHEEGI